MAATVSSGLQNQYSTATANGTVPSDLFIRDVPDWVDKLQRTDVPLQKMFGTDPAPSIPMNKAEWGYGSPDPYSTTLAVGCGSGDTTITVTDGTYFAVNDTFWMDDEMLSVTGIAGDVLTVVRGFAGTTAGGHSAATVITIGLPAVIEGADDPDSPFTQGVVNYNYHQIGSFTWAHSKRRDVTPTYENRSGGAANAELRKKMEHTAPVRFEISLMLGRRSQGSGNTPSSMGGLSETSYITTRTNLAAAPVTETDLMNAMQTVNNLVGSSLMPDTWVCSPFMARAISSFYNETRRSSMSDSKANVKFSEIETWFGTVKIVPHYLFTSIPQMNNKLFLLNPSDIKRRPYASSTGWNTGNYHTQGWHTRGFLRGDHTTIWQKEDARAVLYGASVTAADYPAFS